MSKFSAKRANLGLKWENLGLKLENLEQKWANLGRYQARRVPRVSITEHRASRVREKMDRAPSIEYSARYSRITSIKCLLRHMVLPDGNLNWYLLGTFTSTTVAHVFHF